MIVFSYHSADPAKFDRGENEGACVGRAEVSHASAGTGYMATVGAKQLGLPPGRYIAVQQASDRRGVVIGWSWIIDVEPPRESIVRIVE